jgi:hypothetical protein
MSHVEYHARMRPPAEVEADLCRLWSENLRLTTRPEEKFRWLYRDAPDVADVVFVLEAVLDGQTRVVGTSGMAIRRFRVAGRDVRAAISCDLAVDRAHRSLLPALCLVRAIREAATARFDLIYGFPNSKAEGVFKRAGFRELGRATRWAKVLRRAYYVQGAGSRTDAPAVARAAAWLPWLGKLGATILDAFRAALAPGTARLVGLYQLRTLPAPDGRWDALWQAARSEYDVVGTRTSEFLRWRFPPSPRTRFVTLQRRGEDRLRAYAIIEFDATSGAAHVRDLFGHREDLRTLIDALVRYAYREGAASVSVRFLGAPEVERLLKRRGFVLRGGDRCIVAEVGPAFADRDAIATDACRWHLFDVDEDA